MAKAKAVVGIDIGSSAVKIVELSRRDNTLTVTGVAREPYSGEGDIPTAVQTAMSVGGFRAKRVAASVSGRTTGVVTRKISGIFAPFCDHRTPTFSANF